jgi:hypothetical protein
MKKKLPKDHSVVKKGPLSSADLKFIEDNCPTMDVLDISQRLNRAPKQVEKYKNEFLAKAPRIIAKRSETETLRNELHAGANWNVVKQQFTQLELIFYENQYIEYRRHFRETTHMELAQLHQLITLDIFMNRHNIDRKRAQDDIDRITKLLDKEYLRDRNTLTSQELGFITHNEQQVAALKAASTTKTREYKDLLDKHTDLMKSLKATRDQRIRSNQDQGKFIGILYELELESRRSSVSTENALAEMAKQKELERLSQPFQYNDKSIDIPILNHETNLPDYD